jgi:glycosyltransferase involved in cell wall biosynthesis
MSMPAVSVILPVYNGGEFLGKAIESILGQSFRDFEFIIINDGSKDNSQNVIDGYAAKDDRIIAVHQENAGVVATLNRGLSMAKAPLIARMDADDIALPERFAIQAAYMASHSDIAVLGSFIRLIDESDRPIRDILYPVTPAEIAREVLRGSPFAHPAVMMRKDALEQAVGYNPLYKHGEDYELWLRLSEKYRMANLPEVLMLYRQHPQKISFQYASEQMLTTIVAQLASERRRSGKPDPVVTDIKISTLDLFGLPDAEKSKILFRIYEYSLSAHVLGPDDRPLLDMLQSVKQQSGHESHFRYFFSLMQQKVAQHYFYRKKYVRFFSMLLQAFFTSPKAFFVNVIKLGRKIIRKLKRKLSPCKKNETA